MELEPNDQFTPPDTTQLELAVSRNQAVRASLIAAAGRTESRPR